jgi:hypothetical protein
MRMIMIAILMVFWLAAPGWADNNFKEGAREIGQGFKEGSIKIGHGFQELGKDIKQVSKECAVNFKNDTIKAGKEAGKTGQSIGMWFKDKGKKTGDAFRELGRNTKKFFTGV